MPRVALGPLFAAFAAGCIPRVEEHVVPPEYEWQGFRGPSTIPAPPEPAPAVAVDLSGFWRVATVEPTAGTNTDEHVFRVGTFVELASNQVVSVFGLPPVALVPNGADWFRNEVAAGATRLGFGWDDAPGDIPFLQYALVLVALDEERARAYEVFHMYVDDETATPPRSIVRGRWLLELERQGAAESGTAPPALPVPRPWLER
jgi:hypothetical protein